MTEKKSKIVENSLHKQECILNGAELIFAEEGYDSVSMDQVSFKSGSSKRTVYKYFPSKEVLFLAVIQRLLDTQWSLRNIQYEKDKPLETSLKTFADAEIFLISHPHRLGLSRLLTSVFVHKPLLALQGYKRYEDPHQFLRKWIQEAQKHGHFKSSNPEIAADMFFAIIEGSITWPALFRPCQNGEAYNEAIQECIRTFLARYYPEYPSTYW